MHLSPKAKPNRLSFGHMSPILNKNNVSVRSRGNISSPVLIKNFQSTSTFSPRYQSSVNKIRHDLAILLPDLIPEGTYLQKAKNACKALELCSNEESIYQKEMGLIVKSIKESIFKDRSLIPDEVLSNIYENHTEAILDNKDIPYFFIAESSVKLLENSQKTQENLKSELDLMRNRKV